jgi:sugar phosphate isomerase/epimerase
MTQLTLSRRSFLSMTAAAPWAFSLASAAPNSAIPVGLELYSVREALKQDPEATVRAVAKMGYQCVEFYAPYFAWTEAQTKNMRKLMDDLDIRCYSTHNDSSYLTAEKIHRTADLNNILGAKYAVMSSADPKASPKGWMAIVDALNFASDQLEPSGLKTGYHNHQPEFTREGDQRPIEILAKNTKPTVMLQLDVGTCVEAGSDPVAWIRANPGRIHSIHCKDWAPGTGPDKGYRVLFGEGITDWKAIFAAAESVGGVEYYLVEQEGSRFSEFDTAQRCLQSFRTIHAI